MCDMQVNNQGIRQRGFKFLTEWRERIEVRDRDEGRVQGCKFVTELREEC